MPRSLKIRVFSEWQIGEVTISKVFQKCLDVLLSEISSSSSLGNLPSAISLSQTGKILRSSTNNPSEPKCEGMGMGDVITLKGEQEGEYGTGEWSP